MGIKAVRFKKFSSNAVDRYSVSRHRNLVIEICCEWLSKSLPAQHSLRMNFNYKDWRFEPGCLRVDDNPLGGVHEFQFYIAE